MTPASEPTPHAPRTAPEIAAAPVDSSPSTGSGQLPMRDRPSGARGLVTVLAVVAFAGLVLILGYLLDAFVAPDQLREGALGIVILGAAILSLSGLPMLVVIFLPWWRRAVAAPLREEGRGRVIRILWWSAGACGLGMLYALRYLAKNLGDWRLVVDEEVTLVPLLLLILAAFLAMTTGVGWAKVLARVVFIVFFIPWIIYNPLGSLVGLGIMFFGLRSLRNVQPDVIQPRVVVAAGQWSPDRAYWWDGSTWRQTSPDRSQFWDGIRWRSIAE